MYTVAVFVLYSTHSGSFSVLVDGLTHLWFPTHPTIPNPLLSRPPPIELIHDIGGVQKKVSQNPYKALAIRLLCKSGIHAARHQKTTVVLNI